jgi:iron complex outermembrane receptor protein
MSHLASGNPLTLLRRYALCAGFASAVGLASGAAVAAAPPAGGADSDRNGIQEVVVTAQRREQKLQDVGISVTALGNESLTNLNINSATDIVRAVPSLKMNAYSSAQVVYNIRGVSQNDYGDQQEPPVAVYQDDSYSSSINSASFPVFDLARVETLRGPQGTLFGRNATGGAIQFISHRPTKDFEGFATAIYGRFHQSIIEGAVSGPLADTLQGRFAFIRNKDDGYMESIVPGVIARGANDHYALRGQLAWQPVDGTNVNLILRYLRANKERQAGLYSHEAACPNANLQGEFTPPTLTCPYWAAFINPSFPPVPGTATGFPGPGTTGTGYRNDGISPSRGGNPWATAETTPSWVDRTIKGGTLRIDSTLGAVDLVSITDYQKSEKFYIEGGDSSPDAGVFFFQGSNLKQYSEEIRLSGKAGPHRIVGGLFGMRIDGDYTGKFADPFYGYDPLMAATQSTKSFAVFLQDEWQAMDRLSVIAGLRYWHDRREGSYFGTEPSNAVTIIFNSSQVAGLVNGVPPVPSFPIDVTPADADKTFTGVTGRFELDYRMSDALLLFTSYNRGSKSGGFTFSTGTPFALPGAPEAFLNGIPFRPEVLNAIEAGFKSTLGRTTTLNASAFYYDYKDYQAFAQRGIQQTVVNLPATVLGLEAEITSHPTAGLTLQLGTSALNTRVKHVLLPDLVTEQDHELPQAPKFSGNALARYEHAFGGGLASLQADVQYSSKFCFTVLCAPDERERAYSVTNARIGYLTADRHWEFATFVDNIFDRQYRVYAFDSSLFAGVVAGVYGKPRTWGVSASYHFGEAHN